MDAFDSRYYSLTRKLLLLVGQWPYQRLRTRIVKTCSLLCVALSEVVVQIAKVMTTKLTVSLLAEVIAIQIAVMITAIKYFTIPLQEKKIKLLLQTINSDWNRLTSLEDKKIADQSAEEGRKYRMLVAMYLYSSSAISITVVGLQPIFNMIVPTNLTYEKVTLYPGEYFVDPDTYFYPILLHMSITVIAATTVVVATDTMYLTCIHHACGMFKIVGHRLEHAFDIYKQGNPATRDMNKETRVKIANAVEYHHTVTEYMRVVVSAYEVSLFIAYVLVIANISLTLCCALFSLGKLNEMLPLLLFGLCQAFQTLLLTYPGQQMMDNSSAISLHAYCGQWYIAPFQLQTLILPILHRGTKPTLVCLLRLITMTMEFYAKAVQMSLSYLTVLLSFR